MSAAFESSAEEILRLDAAHIWPPYTSPEEHAERPPLVAVAAKGGWIDLADGRRVLDGNGSWWVNPLGHSHPRLVRALTRQAEVLAHVSYGGITHAPAVLLARELLAVAPPGLERVHFSDDGSTSVEVAIKIAVQHWAQTGRPERKRLIALGGAYHGDTVGAVSLGGVAAFRQAYGALCFDVVRPPEASDPDGWEKAIDAICRVLETEGDSIAGVVVEPLVQGAAGMRMWGAPLLSRLREKTREVDTFLIADEVFTGYGRTGKMWACDHAEVTPDLLCTSKAFSGGMLPMAATLATARVYDGFRGGPDRALMHGHSFCGNPLGAAVAREVLAIYREEDVVGQVARKASIIREGFERIAGLKGVRRVRSLGMIGAADIGAGGYRGEAGWRVYDEALAHGAYLRPLGDTVYVTPPLTLPDDELEQLLKILHDAVASALA